MRYLSLFSGIEAFTVAVKDLPFEAVGFSEIDPFPCAVLQYHYPQVTNYGDITKLDGTQFKGKIDLIVGGSPCFVAGTQVLCIEGLKRIEEVAVGDLVFTHEFRWRRVEKTGSQLSATVYLTDEDGGEVYCTPEHPFYSVTGEGQIPKWVQAKDLKGKYWGIPAIDLLREPRNNIEKRLARACDSGKRIYWREVKRIEHGRKERVYNLQVQDDKSFIANGFIAHNCQSVSVAGLRQGMEGESGLVAEYNRILRESLPQWFIWENVTGALSQDKGLFFRQVLQEWAHIGYGVAWRVLDSSGFGVAQRRRRVFAVGYFGDFRPPAKVLFEPEGLRRDFEESGKKRKVASTVAREKPAENCGKWPRDKAATLTVEYADKLGIENQHIDQGAPLYVPDPSYYRQKGFGDFVPDNKTGSILSHEAKGGRGADNGCIIEETPAYCFSGKNIGRKIENTQQGEGYKAEQAYALTGADRHVVAEIPTPPQRIVLTDTLSYEQTALTDTKKNKPIVSLQATSQSSPRQNQNKETMYFQEASPMSFKDKGDIACTVRATHYKDQHGLIVEKKQ